MSDKVKKCKTRLGYQKKRAKRLMVAGVEVSETVPTALGTGRIYFKEDAGTSESLELKTRRVSFSSSTLQSDNRMTITLFRCPRSSMI